MMHTGLIGLGVMMALVTVGDPAGSHGDGRSAPTHKVTEVLMIGTFHFNNPKRDMVKTKSFDVLSAAAQEDLEEIAAKIAAFGPTKIFVEYDYDKQEKLDGLYAGYVKGELFSEPSLSEYYRRGEIFQLAFRAARKLGHKKVYAVDYTDTESPYGDMMQVIQDNGQVELQAEIDALIKRLAAEMNRKIDSGASLTGLLDWLNSSDSRARDVAVYTELFTRAGGRTDFEGAHLVSEWYRRNIYIWSLIQKQVTEHDQKIMVLFGSGHVAVLDQILSSSRVWKTIDFKELMNQ